MFKNRFDAIMFANFSGISINIINNEEASAKANNGHRHKLQEIWKEINKKKAKIIIMSKHGSVSTILW